MQRRREPTPPVGWYHLVAMKDLPNPDRTVVELLHVPADELDDSLHDSFDEGANVVIHMNHPVSLKEIGAWMKSGRAISTHPAVVTVYHRPK